MIGETILHYKIVKKIGEGGMGVVYKAQDTKLDRIVALKFLPKHLTAGETERARFLQEARAASALNHPNVCVVHDIMEHEGYEFIVMEYIDGVTLRKKLQDAPLKLKDAVHYAVQIGDALQAAHDKGIVHRDVKTENIMITSANQVKVMDFGLAKLKGALKLTKTSSTVGTLAYMSPEQIRGEETDNRSDIFSFGVVVYEMLTCKMPFRGEYESAMMYSILNEDPQPVQQFRPELSLEWLHVLNRVLEKDPADRYQSVNDMLIDLRRLKRETSEVSRKLIAGVQVPETGVFEKSEAEAETARPETTKKRSRFFMIPGILIAAAVIITAGYFLYNRILKTGEPEAGVTAVSKVRNSIAIMYFENNTDDESIDHWRKTLAELLIADLSQSQYINVMSGDRLFNILEQLDQLDAKSYSSDVLQEVTDRGRVENILRGSYAKAGNTFRLYVTIQEAGTGNIIGSERVEGEGEESMFNMVDELTKKIKENLKLSTEEIAGDIDREVGQITTRSPEALKYYSEARKYHRRGDNNQAIPFYEKAVAADSGFVMAYRETAIAYDDLGKRNERDKYRNKALELTDRASFRERYTILGDFYKDEGSYDKAIQAYNDLLQLYPDDETGNVNLGSVYRDLEAWDNAIKKFKRLTQMKSETIYPYVNLFNVYNAMGLYDKAREFIAEIPPGAISDARKPRYFASSYIYEGKLDLALVEANKALELEPDNYENYCINGDIYLYMGDFNKAEENYQRIMEFGELNTYYLRMGAIYLLQGQFEQYINQHEQRIQLAKEQENKVNEWESSNYLSYLYLSTGHSKKVNTEVLDEAWDRYAETGNIAWKSAILYYKGWTYVEQELLDEAEKKADEISKMIYRGTIKIKRAERDYNHLMGRIELKRNNFSKAFDYFEKALSTLPAQRNLAENHGFFMGPLASAYYSAGELNKAQATYEKIQSLTTGRLEYGDIYAKSFYNLGKTYQEKGSKGKAIVQYTKFIELWKDCDPELRWMVDDAQQQIDLLK